MVLRHQDVGLLSRDHVVGPLQGPRQQQGGHLDEVQGGRLGLHRDRIGMYRLWMILDPSKDLDNSKEVT
jgi:hypothetical protein